MIPIEGNVTLGLDEFMLRLGHLRLLCRIARDFRASKLTLEREMSSVLGKLVPIPQANILDVARYLKEKRLCLVCDAALSTPPDLADRLRTRYPELWVTNAADQIYFDIAVTQNAYIAQQDLWLSAPQVRSRVGAIPISRAKASSKTGVSHIIDWALILELMTASGELTAEGHLVGSFAETPLSYANPYILGLERLIFAFLAVTSDFDVFARFAKVLATSDKPITRQSGINCFRTAVIDLLRDAEVDRRLSSAHYRRISSLAKEIGAEPEATEAQRAKTASTAWHRASSRLETYVDLGLLQKLPSNPSESYQYLYRPTVTLNELIADFDRADSRWPEEHFLTLLGMSPSENTELPDLLRYVPELAKIMRRPTSLLPITGLSLGIALCLAQDKLPTPLTTIRAAIEQLAITNPEQVRLSRGGQGERAEVVSINVRAMTSEYDGAGIFY